MRSSSNDGAGTCSMMALNSGSTFTPSTPGSVLTQPALALA